MGKWAKVTGGTGKTGKTAAFLLVAALALSSASCFAASTVSETDGRFVRIILRSPDACGEQRHEWRYEAEGEGAFEEVSMSDYFDAATKQAAQKTPPEDGMIELPDMPVPGGYVEFYFRGVRPGMVNLRFVCIPVGQVSPIAEAAFRLAVFSDLKIGLFGSSETHGRPDR